MKNRSFYLCCALVVLTMLSLVGCSGSSSSSVTPGANGTLKASMSGSVELPAAKLASAAAATVGKVEVFNAYSSSSKAALGSADVQADGTFSGLDFTLPAKQSVVVFKATLTGPPVTKLYNITPMDLTTPATAAGLANNNVTIAITKASTVTADAALKAQGATLDTQMHTDKAFTAVAQSVITNGGYVLTYAANGIKLSGTVDGSAATTNETCVVCHSAGNLADIALLHNFTIDTANNNTLSKPRLNEKNLSISNIVVSATAGNLPKIAFKVKNGTANYTALGTGEARFYIADLVPANTATVNYGTWGSDYFETWANATPTTTGAVWDVSDAANGNYAITFPNTFGVASSSSYHADDYNAAHTQRAYIRLSSNTTVPGVGGVAGILDFAVPAAGNTAVALANPAKQFVTVAACKKCHGPQMNGTAHGSSYLDTLGCIVCHTPLGGAAEEYYLPKFIHQIHAAIPVEGFETRIGGRGYGAVTYPQEISKCDVCHTASGQTLGAGDKIDNWKNNPTAEVCGSCHTTLDFATGANHAGGARTNASCGLCHDATTIASAHTPAPAAKNVPEYDVTLTLSDPANKADQVAAGKLPFYAADEQPVVTVTLKDHATGAAVPGALYTAASHKAGSSVAGSLSKAALYVYGPRANTVPVLTKASATLSATFVPSQAQSLFVNAADAQILTDDTGFKYKLSAIPAGMSGTFMVRFIAANYGYKADTDYKIDSVAFTTIQIGTATVEPKLDGTGCVDCHGAGNLEAHDARHSVVFDVDQCKSCHDKSGNHADPIDNRVHAIHSASKKGDLAGADWSAVTYPQGIPSIDATTGLTKTTAPIRCATCHNSTSVAYKNVSMSKKICIGCHADKPAAIDHFNQMGGK